MVITIGTITLPQQWVMGRRGEVLLDRVDGQHSAKSVPLVLTGKVYKAFTPNPFFYTD